MLFPCSSQRSRSIRSSSWSNRTADSSRPKEQSADAPLPRQGLRGDSLADAFQILTLILIHIGKIKNRPLCTVPPSQISDSRLRRGLPHSPFAPSMTLRPPVDFNGEGAIAFGSKRGMQPWNHSSYRIVRCARMPFSLSHRIPTADRRFARNRSFSSSVCCPALISAFRMSISSRTSEANWVTVSADDWMS